VTSILIWRFSGGHGSKDSTGRYLEAYFVSVISWGHWRMLNPSSLPIDQQPSKSERVGTIGKIVAQWVAEALNTPTEAKTWG